MAHPPCSFTLEEMSMISFPLLQRGEICARRFVDLDGLSLNELLGLGDTDVLCNMLKDARTTVSELKQKLVGLYVCFDCRSLGTIQEVREECRRQKYELEVVVVCCPPPRVPPRLQQELVMDALASHKMLDVWFFPFNNTVSQRLDQMREIDSFEEGLFIVDSKEQYVDTYGLAIIHDFGIGCYPYTRRTLVQKEFQRLRGLRLSSLLLPWEHVCRKPDDSTSSVDEIPVAQALNNNKIVLLYLYTERYKSRAKKLAEFTWREKNTRRKPSNVEVVAVSIDGSGTSDKDFMEKGLLVCSADPTKSAKLCADFFHPALCGPHETLAAFDEDGRITSMNASQFLEKSPGSPHPPFHGNLREEIREEFNEAMFLYMLHC
ncbi:unnamed protein product [Cuscuta campestris]|uniref:Thioredoxin-like fold domain-containing protein n=1 Tax=Cuscuta campestris TaxID=132261 RepID=A0A484MUA4_9ASTE|nr:unnamed protein product [Cuscuta campestris]